MLCSTAFQNLKLFLNKKNGFEYTAQKENADWVITLLQDPSLKEGGFRVISTKKGKQLIELSGTGLLSSFLRFLLYIQCRFWLLSQ